MTYDDDINFSHSPWFIATKLSPPSVPHARLIERHAAIAELESINRYRVCFLAAPAGYGKTCLLTDWRHQELAQGAHVAWLSLEENDSEIRQFLSYIILSIANSGVSVGDLEFAAQQGLVDISPHAIVPRLINTLMQSEIPPLTLILDDYHRASCGVIDSVVNNLITHSPKCLRIIISCRTLPDFDISTLFASGAAFEFASEQLRLTRDETHEVVGDVVDKAVCDEIFEQTEGWAVAVQLARLANESADNSVASTPAYNDEHIINYFTRQILDQSTEEERSFLLQTSILDRFSPELAATVTGNKSILSFIHQSRHVRSLLISLDETGSWYRYHHLFSDLLLQQLKIQNPDQLPILHKKASIWFEQNGLILDSVKHAKAAGDTPEAARMVMDAGGWELVLFGGIPFIRSLLRHFERRDFEKFPRLRVTYAYSLIKDGKIKDAEAQLALIRSNPIDDETFHRDYYIIHTLLSTYKDALVAVDEVDELRNRTSLWNTKDVLGLGVLQAALAVSEMALGAFDAAEQSASRSVMSMRQADSVIGVNYSYIHLGQCAFYRGDFELARAHFTGASSMAEDNFGADSRLKTNCDISLFALNFWQRPDILDRDALSKSLISACETDSWCDIYMTGFTALFELLRISKSHSQIQEAQNLYQTACLNRDINRLTKLGSAYSLNIALVKNTHKDIALAIDACTETLRDANVMNEPGFWMVKFETLCILAIANLEGHQVDGLHEQLDDAIRISEEIGANLFLVRLLVLRGSLRAERKGADAGLSDISSAARLAARASIHQPFCATRAISKYLRSVIRIGRELPECRLEVSFLTECLVINPRSAGENGHQFLSAREHDVLEELARGKSNKEIARFLDMTDHTVKFHLKNIFKKLSVDNRIAAINTSRELDLI